MARGEMTGALQSDFLIVLNKKQKREGEDPEFSGVIFLLILIRNWMGKECPRTWSFREWFSY